MTAITALFHILGQLTASAGLDHEPVKGGNDRQPHLGWNREEKGGVQNLPSQKDAEPLFWRVMRIVLIVGFVSLTLTGLFLWRPAGDNPTGQALVGSLQHLVGVWSDPVLWLLGIGVWAGAIAFARFCSNGYLARTTC